MNIQFYLPSTTVRPEEAQSAVSKGEPIFLENTIYFGYIFLNVRTIVTILVILIIQSIVQHNIKVEHLLIVTQQQNYLLIWFIRNHLLVVKKPQRRKDKLKAGVERKKKHSSQIIGQLYQIMQKEKTNKMFTLRDGASHFLRANGGRRKVEFDVHL